MFRAKACYPHASCLRECASARAASLGHRAPECNLSVVAWCLGVRRAQLSRSRRATTEKNGCLQRAGPCRKALRSMIWSRLLLSSSFAPGSFGGSLVQRWRSCSSELPSAGCCGTQARPASSSSERAAWSEASQSEDACLVAGPWRGWLEQTDDDTQISFAFKAAGYDTVHGVAGHYVQGSKDSAENHAIALVLGRLYALAKNIPERKVLLAFDSRWRDAASTSSRIPWCWFVIRRPHRPQSTSRSTILVWFSK